MLILTRSTGEAVCIEGGIRVVVLNTDGKKVRLGIEAPADVTVLREEVVERIAEENRRAELPAGARAILEGLDDLEEEADAEPSPGAPEAPSTRDDAE
jgi:carbon storage regulator